MAAIITSRPNVPEEVVIGTQIWMKRNYDFGGTHPDNVYDNINDYGKLYTWDEAMAINLPGWHLPTSTEIQTLRQYVGSNADAGGYLKEIGTDHWLTPNTDATDSVGFSARGAGNNEINFNTSAFFWSSTEFDADEAWCLRLDYNNATAVEGVALKTFRLSVRLIKDVPQALELTFDSITNVPVADASSASDWNTFFDLPTYGTPFTGCVIEGNTVRLCGGHNIIFKNSLFSSNQNIIKVIDYAGCVIELESYTLGDNGPGGMGGQCGNLTTVYFPEVKIIGNSAFFFDSNLVDIYFPKAESIEWSAFSYTGLIDCVLPEVLIIGENSLRACWSLKNVSLPKCLTISSTGAFQECYALETIYIPSCTTMGSSVGYNYLFVNISEQEITLTIPAALMTCNGGAPDGDIQYLQANNTVTIITV